MIYILKIKGTDQIPDFVQIRDDKMALKAYFRLSQIEKGLKKNKIESNTKKITKYIEKMPYGKIQKYYE